MTAAPEVLFPESEIAARVAQMAREIAPRKPEIAIAILIGGFVFAADLIRALSRLGVDLEVEFLWLRSYGNARSGSAVSLLAGPSENVRGKRVLLVDGVLDIGRTIVGRLAEKLRCIGLLLKAQPNGCSQPGSR